MEYSIDKYRFHSSNNKVVAISSYAGKTVRGIAKCDPEDTFSIEAGKAIASARCNEIIAEKRLKRAEKQYNEACENYLKAHNALNRMSRYFTDASNSLNSARKHTEEVLNKFAP